VRDFVTQRPGFDFHTVGDPGHGIDFR
jgi:hypothetical protein